MDKGIRVLYIADTYEQGGAYFSLLGLIESLKEYHKDITPVLLSSKYGKNNVFADKNEIENYYIGHKAFLINKGSTYPRRVIRFLLKPFLEIRYKVSNITALRKVERCIDLSTFDIVHSNSNRNDIGAEISRKYSIPHVWHIREFSDWDYDCFTLRKDYISYMNNNVSPSDS